MKIGKKNKVEKKSTKKLTPEDPPVKTQQTFDVKFTKNELIHLRDLFSVLLPPDGYMTISQALAKNEGRIIIEKLLFDKIFDVCQTAKLPVGEEAPDYIVGLSESPVLGVFQMSEDDSAQEQVEVDDDDEEPGELFKVSD